MKNKTKVAFFDTKIYDIETFTKINTNDKIKIKFYNEKLNINTAIMAKGYEVVCVFVNDDLNKEVIKLLSENGLKYIVLRCAGYNNIDLSAAAKYNIKVARVPAYSPYSIAEHALALIFTLNRKTHKAYFRTRDGNFNINGLMGFDLHNKTIGVIGTGRIGQIFISIVSGLGMNILAYDPFPNEELKKRVKFVELDELYKNSDIISLHCPLTKDTYHLINEKSINKMKDNVMLINTSRGKLIDTQAVINSLKDKKIGSAGLDVYEEEGDYFFEDLSHEVIEDDVLARLLTFSNVLITSHQGFFTREALDNIAESTFENIIKFSNGEENKNEICAICG